MATSFRQYLHAQLRKATCTARLGHLIGLLSLSQYTIAEGESIYSGLRYGRQRYAPFSRLLLDLLPVSRTSYKQVSKWLAQYMSYGENMDNFTTLYASYLHFAFSTNSMHAFSHAYGILVFSPAFFYKFMLCLIFRSKTVSGTINHAQNA